MFATGAKNVMFVSVADDTWKSFPTIAENSGTVLS